MRQAYARFTDVCKIETMNRPNIRFDISLRDLKRAFRYIFSPQIEEHVPKNI